MAMATARTHATKVGILMQQTPSKAITPATDGTPLADRERRGMQQKPTGNVARPLPEYLTASEVDVMLDCAPHEDARLLMLIQWRAGLRISEALALTWADVRLDEEQPTIRVRRGKGNRPRMVPLHSELRRSRSSSSRTTRGNGSTTASSRATGRRRFDG